LHVLFLFVDGIGLGDDDAEHNPFAIAHMPTLIGLTNGWRWLKGIGRQRSERAVFIPTDPRLGVPGRPQSGSNHAVILTGRNVPQIIGRHYGPKPDGATRAMLAQDNIFKRLTENGKRAGMLVGYPAGLLQNIERGKTLPSGMQQGAISGGQGLFTIADVEQQRALTAEYTGKALREYTGDARIPVLSEYDAGVRLVELARDYDFALHSHWMTDYIGHRGPLEKGVELLEVLDGVLAGVLDAWDDDDGLVILTSDHGNMEYIGDRRHTENDVPTLIIGRDRDAFAEGFASLLDFAPRILRCLLND
jgi:2,3-bisphosphoglycerate-independent phosphoglycerate mutase